MVQPAADPLSVLQKRRLPGIVVVDMDANVVYVNAEAGSRLSFGQAVSRVVDWRDNPLYHDVLGLAKQLMTAAAGNPEITNLAAIHIADEDTYGLRADFIAPPGAMAAGRLVVVQVDAVSLQREVDFDAVRRRYKVSRREQDVLRMLYYGKANKEIAELLFISEYTVKDHIKSVMAKMVASSRAEIVYKLTTTA